MYYNKKRFFTCTRVIILFAAILFITSSCATKTKIEYRDRDVNHYITNVVHDTLIDKTTDSVYVNVYTKGDTVFKEKYKERTRWRDRIVERHDTCYKDSIVIETTEPFSEGEGGINLQSKQKEFTIKKGQKIKLTTPTMDAGGIYYFELN